MKNVLVVLAFMFMSSLAFASSGEKAETNSAADVKIERVVEVVEVTNGGDPNDASVTKVPECTIRGEFTITDEKGRSFSWKGSLTLVGVTCSQLLKELMTQ